MTSKHNSTPWRGHALIASQYLHAPNYMSRKGYLIALAIAGVIAPTTALLLSGPPTYWLAPVFFVLLGSFYGVKVALPERRARAAYISDLHNLTSAISYFELLVPLSQLATALNSDPDLPGHLHEYHAAWDRLRARVDLTTFFNARLTALATGDFDFAHNVEKDIAERIIAGGATHADIEDVLEPALRRCIADGTLNPPAMRATIRKLLYTAPVSA